MYDDKYLEETLRYAFHDPEYYYVPKGIRRHDYGNVHGWWVRVQRDRTPFRNLFSDGVSGSISDSLKDAIIHRHSILSNFPVTIKKISNKGLPPEPEKRIQRFVSTKKRIYIYWKARWYDKNHKIRTAQFAVSNYGEEGAKAKALEAARIYHNKKPKLTKVNDPYFIPKYDPIPRADVDILATISSTPRSQSKKDTTKLAAHDPFKFEGERKIVLHRSIERDRQFRNQKANMFLETHGRLFCELCNFSFIEKYPFLSTDIIEVHHIIPLAKLTKNAKVRFEDLMLLCSNCHFAVHQGDAEDTLLTAMEHFETLVK